MGELHIAFAGPPRTKKNVAWETCSLALLRPLLAELHAGRATQAASQAARVRASEPLRAPLQQPINCCALFYRTALVGDAVGYYQALADLLEKAGVVVNDKWITSWDGSKLLKDAARPRVELVLTWETAEAEG